MRTIILTGLLFLTLSCFGQEEKKGIDAIGPIGQEAYQALVEGQYNMANGLYTKLLEDHPDNFNINLGFAYTNFYLKNIDISIPVLITLKKHQEVTPNVYQLLGNCYDRKEEWMNAILTYQEGIQLFPDFGGLYSERGIVELMRDDYEKALDYFEEGIKVDPYFASNYYWASRIYCNTTEKVWGMVYGEMFINLERNTQRTEQMSRLLFDVYRGEIQVGGAQSSVVTFSQFKTISPDDIHQHLKHKVPFGTGVYEPVMLTSVGNEKEINLTSLNRIRSKFLDEYIQGKYQEEEYYSNILFGWQAEIQKSGHMEAYNHWLLLMGDEGEFAEWFNNNKEKYHSFLDWYASNNITIKE